MGIYTTSREDVANNTFADAYMLLFVVSIGRSSSFIFPLHHAGPLTSHKIRQYVGKGQHKIRGSGGSDVFSGRPSTQ
jgi:hypothetical protein